MSIKHKIKLKSYRGRGTSSAELRSTGPKLRPEEGSVESSALDGESARRSVSTNDMKPMTREEEYRNADVPMPKDEDYDGGKAYTEFLRLFFKGKNNE